MFVDARHDLFVINSRKVAQFISLMYPVVEYLKLLDISFVLLFIFFQVNADTDKDYILYLYIIDK